MISFLNIVTQYLGKGRAFFLMSEAKLSNYISFLEFLLRFSFLQIDGRLFCNAYIANECHMNRILDVKRCRCIGHEEWANGVPSRWCLWGNTLSTPSLRPGGWCAWMWLSLCDGLRERRVCPRALHRVPKRRLALRWPSFAPHLEVWSSLLNYQVLHRWNP